MKQATKLPPASAENSQPTGRGLQKRRRSRLGFFILALLLGLVLSVVVFNTMERKKDLKVEITFIDPRQAVIFWHTDHPTVGFVTYGERKNSRPHRAEQTSSVPGQVHAVIINDVPLDGLYFTIHSTSDSTLYWPEVRQIHFDPTTIE